MANLSPDDQAALFAVFTDPGVLAAIQAAGESVKAAMIKANPKLEAVFAANPTLVSSLVGGIGGGRGGAGRGGQGAGGRGGPGGAAGGFGGAPGGAGAPGGFGGGAGAPPPAAGG
jgi:hypothetical protein